VAAVLQWGDRKLTIPVRNNHASHPIGLSGEPIAQDGPGLQLRPFRRLVAYERS
jgi:hypothetical protein